MTALDRITAALKVAEEHASIDGAHHKQWVIDQMVRALTGSTYNAWVALYENGEDGPNTYRWDEGIEP